MGSKGATTTTTSAPPKVVEDMYKYLTEQGKTLQQQPYQPYTGQMVAELNPIQQQGISQAQQYSQAAQPYYQGAAAGTLGAMQGYTPEAFQQGVGGYMSPYLQNAMGSTAAYLANQQAQQRQELLGKTIQQGAFGGDRGKIAQAALMGQQNLATGQTLGQMAQQGYADAARNYMAGLAGQGALSAQLGQLGTQAQTAGLTGAQAVAQAGATPYQVEQAKLASQYGQFAQGQAYPFQTLGYLANIASGLGAGQGGTSSTTAPGPNVLGQAFGTALSLASLPWSDKRLKHDVKEVGETFDGQPIYSFKYNGDNTTHIGLMAQDVEKKHPEAVGLAGGYKTVDYDKATEGAAERGKFYLGGASMGGLVPATDTREAYATKGGVSVVPYEDDPLSQLMSEYQKIALAKYIPELSVRAGGVGIPEAPKAYEDKESSYLKGLDVMPDFAKANLVKNLKSAYSNIFNYAEGGLVPRTEHKEGLATPVDQNATTPSNAPVSFIEKTFNQGKPYSDEARAGLLAAGLGMLASRSPFVGTAVGEGAIGGLSTYYNALKNKMEMAKGVTDIEKTQAETAKTKSELYEKVWIQGLGWFVYDKTKPMSAPKQITDANLTPISNIDPNTVPTAANSPSPSASTADTTQPPTASTAAPAGAATSSTYAPVTETKKPDEAKATWKPITELPKGYMPEDHANIMFSEDRKKAESALANETLKNARSESQNAYDQLYRMNEMDKQFANLDDQGFLSPGSYANERMALAKDVNTLTQILGGAPIFDPNDIGSMEALSKDTFRLGTELTRSLGANEPGKIVEAAVKANPGIENTKTAYRRIIAGLREAAMYKRDRAAFYDKYAAKFGHLVGADQLFAQLNPPDRYAQRAIVSTVDPRDISEAKKYIQNNPDYPEVAKAAIDKRYGAGVADLVLGK